MRRRRAAGGCASSLSGSRVGAWLSRAVEELSRSQRGVRRSSRFARPPPLSLSRSSRNLTLARLTTVLRSMWLALAHTDTYVVHCRSRYLDMPAAYSPPPAAAAWASQSLPTACRGRGGTCGCSPVECGEVCDVSSSEVGESEAGEEGEDARAEGSCAPPSSRRGTRWRTAAKERIVRTVNERERERKGER